MPVGPMASGMDTGCPEQRRGQDTFDTSTMTR